MASIKQRSKNSYQITVSCGRDIYGKKLIQTITFRPDPTLSPLKREKAVKEFAQDFENTVLSGVSMDGRKITLQNFTKRWLAEYASQELQSRTIEGYTQELDSRILPALGHLKLSEIRPATINSFLLSLGKPGVRKDGKPGGYSKSTIKKSFNVLSSILRTAAEWEVIDRNPCDNIRIRVHTDDVEKVKFFTPEQTSRFLEFIEEPYSIAVKSHERMDDTGITYVVGNYEVTRQLEDQFVVLFNMAIFTGLRKGELLALQWSDIDFENDEVHVTKAVSKVDHKQIIKCPKSKKSNRIVSMPRFLTTKLKELRATQDCRRLRAGDQWREGNWIFVQENGSMMDYDTPYHTFHNVLERYNRTVSQDQQLPLIPFHGLRHTSATLLIAANQDIKTIQTRLGHSEASTTLNIYVHALQENDHKAADALEALFK